MAIEAKISVFNSRPPGNLHPTASERKVQSGFQFWVLPRATGRASYASPENAKARNCRLSNPFLRHRLPQQVSKGLLCVLAPRVG
jgi:hypothetical protein